MNDAKFDSKRRLCPDGGCIGVVGDDGRCRVCGRDAGGAKSAAASSPATVSAAADDDTAFDGGSDDDASDSELAADAAEPGAPAFDSARRLCSDGSCVGLIGADGKCNVCGQPASE
jgi:hypothetical protein